MVDSDDACGWVMLYTCKPSAARTLRIRRVNNKERITKPVRDIM